MNKRLIFKFAYVMLFIFLILFSSYFFLKYQGSSSNEWEETRRPPWGLGVCVTGIDWRDVDNITLVIKIPRINYTDDVIYAIMSCMTDSGHVIQVAAGLYPRNDKWLSYVLYIKDIDKYPQSYTWILNDSYPVIQPGDLISMSLCQNGEGLWSYRIEDLEDGHKIDGTVFIKGSRGFKYGDQEIFALESYTYNPEVFRNMGELVLESVYINDARINGTWYVIGGWDMVHKPLFLVGGGDVPRFISVAEGPGSKLVWRYSEEVVEYYPGVSMLLMLYMIVVIVVIFIILSSRILIKKIV